MFCIRYKPSSVLAQMSEPPSFIYDDNHLPPLATYPPTSSEQPLIVGIHGLATHETHSRGVLLPSRWALTPPSHPYPLRGGYFLLRYYTLTNIKPLTCVVLYVARTFLPHNVAAIERVCGCKDSKFFVTLLNIGAYKYHEISPLCRAIVTNYGKNINFAE